MTFQPRLVAARALGAAALLLAVLSPARAPAAKSPYWIAPGVGFAWLPNEYPVKSERPVVGGLIGARMSEHWAAEARVGYLKSPGKIATDPSLSFLHVEGNVTLFLSGDRRFTPYLTGGVGQNYLHYEGTGSSLHRFTLNGGVGFRRRIGERVAFRFEGRDLAYKVKIPASTLEEYRHHPEVFAGFSFDIGGPPRDRDKDGVPDDDDRCPGTPEGARVDAVGCGIDSDEDGVFDGIDKCPNTPPGAIVDARGCEHDGDFDKVPDGVDRCPDTPRGAIVDAYGCPHDADQDSIYDGIDQCPSTPKGCLVNDNGCPRDSDGDGVCDGIDECPDSPPNVKVDRMGCPIVVSDKETQLLETGMIRLQNVNFDTGRATITPESESVLDEVGNILARWPDLRIEIGGHTDSQGGVAKNQLLGRQRAQAVLNYLTNRFPELNPDQFTAVGYGSSQPIASNATQLGRAKNRRVEFKVLNKEALRREKTKERLLPNE